MKRPAGRATPPGYFQEALHDSFALGSPVVPFYLGVSLLKPNVRERVPLVSRGYWGTYCKQLCQQICMSTRPGLRKALSLTLHAGMAMLSLAYMPFAPT